MSKAIIAPSILSADFANLASDIKKVEEAGADWLHIDVMDGHFVPNITIGVPVVKSIRKITSMPLDVHLMIENPQNYIEDFANAGADIITVHYEACIDLDSTVKKIKKLGKKVGVSIKPLTNVEVVDSFIKKVDLILVMTVEPGFGGQNFLISALDKIEYIKNKKNEYALSTLFIEVDGGINEETSKLVRKYGANAIVAGSYIYNSPDIKASIESLNVKNLL
ncbi:MAG: ribulose-phosphate 3-epimerase [Candidatus Gastranaerophilaceae bacterium]|jgi:ribulose-phosphate 3-epimerase